MTDLEGVLVFAGIPLGVVALVFALVFLTSKKPVRKNDNTNHPDI